MSKNATNLHLEGFNFKKTGGKLWKKKKSGNHYLKKTSKKI